MSTPAHIRFITLLYLYKVKVENTFFYYSPRFNLFQNMYLSVLIRKRRVKYFDWLVNSSIGW